MATRPLEARSMIDELLPNHDVNAAHHMRINAPSSVVYESLLRSDFNELWLVPSADERQERKVAAAQSAAGRPC